MSRIRRAGSLLLLLCALGLPSGCAYKIAVKRGLPAFQERPQKLPFHVGLLIEKPARNYTLNRYGGAYQVGEALEDAAAASLPQAFNEVSVVKGKKKLPEGIDRVAVLEFGARSELRLPRNPTTAPISSTVELVCTVYDRDLRRLWDGTAEANVTRTYDEAETKAFNKARAMAAAGAVLNILPIPGTGALSRSAADQQLAGIGTIVHESLVAALEKVNEQLLASPLQSAP